MAEITAGKFLFDVAFAPPSGLPAGILSVLRPRFAPSYPCAFKPPLGRGWRGSVNSEIRGLLKSFSPKMLYFQI